MNQDPPGSGRNADPDISSPICTIEYIAEYDRIIQEVSIALRKPISRDKYEIIDRGVPHKPGALKPGKMGVYIRFNRIK